MCSLTLYQTMVPGRGSESEVGSLTTYQSFGLAWVLCGQSRGMGSGRSEWGRATMKGKSF
jgi:hypothetical protein